MPQLRVFFNVKMASLTAPVRFNVFSIIDSLVAQHRDGSYNQNLCGILILTLC